MKLKKRVLLPDCHCTLIRKTKSKWSVKQCLSAKRMSVLKATNYDVKAFVEGTNGSVVQERTSKTGLGDLERS